MADFHVENHELIDLRIFCGRPHRYITVARRVVASCLHNNLAVQVIIPFCLKYVDTEFLAILFDTVLLHCLLQSPNQKNHFFFIKKIHFYFNFQNPREKHNVIIFLSKTNFL